MTEVIFLDLREAIPAHAHVLLDYKIFYHYKLIPDSMNMFQI